MSEKKISSYVEACFKYQLEMLMKEIDCLETTIGRMDTIVLATKNWAIVSWTASVGFALSSDHLRVFVGATAILPLVFWLIDGKYRSLQKRSVYRAKKITEFLNGNNLLSTFEEKKLINFHVYDPVGQKYRDKKDYKNYVSMRRTLFFHEVFLIYWMLAAISIFLMIIVIDLYKYT